MADLPAAVMPVRIASVPALVLAYGALAAATLAVRRLVARLPPPHGPARRSGRRVGVAAAAAALVAVLATASSAHDAPPVLEGDVVVSFLDVGQGDATLIQSGATSVLVDTGPPGGPILQRLREAGIERLDGLVLTHAQTDHEGMALEVIARVPDPARTRRRRRLADVRAARAARGAGRRARAAGRRPRRPGDQVRCDHDARAVAAGSRPGLPPGRRSERPRDRRACRVR